MKPLIFNKDNLRHRVGINKETAFIKILDIKVSNVTADRVAPGFIYCDLISTNRKEGINLSIDPMFEKRGTTYSILDPILNEKLKGVNYIELYFKKEEIGELQIELSYTTKNLNVAIDFREFREHFEESNNAKILFSAPFGQGKTTFLEEFFKEEIKNQKKYEVFHLFPVNYSVATNEDIFRLIKTEILVKLLKNDSIEFQKEKFKYLETLPHFALKNAHKILAPFLKAIPAVGESAFGVYEKLEELTQSYFVEHDKLQKDDRKTAEEFIQEAYEDEGSIFEDNFYSKLIRQLVQQIRDQGKETVLIIDDTDRMDPDHIFRILNVFAAHFDAPEYSKNDSNKFGFDKIIIVCDYDNLHRIFCHRFGPLADFAGYIDKFFSNHIFRYNNAEAIKKYIRGFALGPIDKDRLSFLLDDLIQTHSISLRGLIRYERSLNQIQTRDNRFKDWTPSAMNTMANGFIPSIRLLLLILNKDFLIGRLEFCKRELKLKFAVNENNYKEASLNAGTDLAILSCQKFNDEMHVSVELGKGRSYDFHLKFRSIYPQGDRYILENNPLQMTVSGTGEMIGEQVESSMELFYDLLIEVVRKL